MSLESSPHLFDTLQPSTYQSEIVTDGYKSTFRTGVIYRYPGMVPLLEVQGSHYEMGLQYAVLLHDELNDFLKGIEHILHWLAAKQKVPAAAMLEQLKMQAVNIMSKLPQRFIKELEGIAEGTGLPLDTVAFTSLYYDVLMSQRCTGVLMRTEKGGIVHARNNDTASFGGEEVGKTTLVVRYKADGYHTVTHIDFAFFMGVETGYNDQGLTFSEETLNVVKPNPDGFSLPYLTRIILEECNGLGQLPAYFERYPVVGAYGTVWSDRSSGRGLVAELTPWAWARIDMQEPILWNFNHIYSDELRSQQIPRVNINPDLDREAVASTFPQKPFYTVEDALDFISLQTGPDGLDYSHCGARNTICNKAASQAVVFDPDSRDFYLGVGVYYAARQNVYRIYDDFSQMPVLFRPGAPMKPAVVEVARILNLLMDDGGYRDAYINLASKYKDDPQVHFLAAFHALFSRTLAGHAQYAEKAYALAPHIGDYRLFAGLAAYFQREPARAIDLLDGLVLEDVERKHEPLRLFVLKQCWQALNENKAQYYAQALEHFLESYGAQTYFANTLQPLLVLTEGAEK